MSFFKKIFKVMSSGAVSALASYFSTLLVLRYAGLSVYADYIVDLSVLAVIVVLMEIVPTYYIVYKVQEEPAYYKPYATFIWLSMPAIVFMTLLLGYLSPVFKSFSPWIVLYAIGVNIKRYFDVRYQATGQVHRLYSQESIVNMLRVLLILMYVFLAQKHVDIDVIWASMGISQLCVYAYYLTKEDIRSDFFSFEMAQLKVLFPKERKDLGGYYLTTMAKKLRDNILPLSTGYVIDDKQALGVFFFIYKSYAAVAGLLRTLEAFLVNRVNMELMREKMGIKLLVLSVTASVFFMTLMALSSVISNVSVDWIAVLIVSICFIPYTYSIIYRVDAYSKYQTSVVVYSFLAYAFVIIVGVLGAASIKEHYTISLALSIVIAEFINFLLMRIKR